MKEKGFSSKLSALRILFLIAVAAVLLLGSTLGIQNCWDHFNLWGIHPKWIWATGEAFFPAIELPQPIPYQSYLGSLLGMSIRFVSPDYYPDLNWILFAFLLLLASVAQLKKFFPKSPLFWPVLFFFLLMISPREYQQITLGGYVDLILSIFSSSFLISLVRKNYVFSAALASFMVVVKPVFIPWILMIAVSSLFTGDLKKRIFKTALVALSAALVFFSYKFLYTSPLEENSHPAGSTLFYYLRDHVGIIDWARLFGVPLAILKYNNFAVLLALFLGLSFKPTRWVTCSLWIMSTMFLTFAYSFLIPQSSWEIYPSIGRYSLVLVFVPVFLTLYLRKQKNLDGKLFGSVSAQNLVYILLLVAFLVRAPEEIGRASTQPLASRFQLIPKKVVKLKSSLFKDYRNKDCRGDILVSNSWWKENAVKDFTRTLDKTQLIYESLPTRVYFESMRIPKNTGHLCKL